MLYTLLLDAYDSSNHDLVNLDVKNTIKKLASNTTSGELLAIVCC